MKTSFLRRVVLPVGIALVAVAVFALMLKMRPHAPKQRPVPPNPVVDVLTVGPATKPVRITGFGTVEAKRRIDVIPQVSGKIIAKSPLFEAGAVVARGDTLIRIEDTDYRQARARAQAEVAQARLSLALAEQEARVAHQEWDRLQAQLPAGSAPAEPSSLVLHEPQLAQAQAALAAAEASLDLADTNLARCTWTAPFDGRVLTSEADAGEYVRAGNPLGSLYATDVAQVTVPVPAEDMAWIRVGATGGDHPQPGDPVLVEADYAGHPFQWEGVAVRLGGAVDRTSRQVPVVVEINDPFIPHGDRPALLTGMFVTVVFTSTPSDDAVVIPRSALRPNDQVWVVTPAGTITIRPVTVARAGIDQAVISEGLQPGERVCTSNLQFVTEGLPVQVEGEPAAAPDSLAAPEKGASR